MLNDGCEQNGGWLCTRCVQEDLRMCRCCGDMLHRWNGTVCKGHGFFCYPCRRIRFKYCQSCRELLRRGTVDCYTAPSSGGVRCSNSICQGRVPVSFPIHVD